MGFPGTNRENLVLALDLDDTLFPELDYARSALVAAGAEIARRFGVIDVGPGAARFLDADPRPTFPLQRALKAHGIVLSPGDLAEIVETMHAHKPILSPFPGTREIILAVRRYVKLVLVSEGRSITQRRKLEALQFHASFDAVIITEELGAGSTKVSGAPYATLRQRYPSANHFLMIGDDEEKDAQPALQQGFDVALVRRPGVRYVKAPPSQPTFRSIAEALAARDVPTSDSPRAWE